MKNISIAIPTYEAGGRGREVLEYSFERMKEQTYKDFDVVIADHSVNDEIKNLCSEWEDKLDIKYFRNEKNRGSASANTNFSIEKATGKWIKLLCMDDYLFGKYALEIIAENLDNKYIWMATAYWHTYDKKEFVRKHYPSLNDQIYIVNTIGTPSCVIVKNLKDLPKIDKNLTYAYDCEFYYQLIKKYGNPKLIDEPTMVNYLWNNSVSSKVTQELINKENMYILEKHGLHYNDPFNTVTRIS